MSLATAHAIWIGGEAFFVACIALAGYALACDLIRNWRWIVNTLKGNPHDDA